MSHTPGPWHLTMDDTDESSLAEHGEGVRYIRAEGTPSAIMGSARYYPWTPDNFDDWRLIAAAPDLLAACKEFVRKCDQGEALSTRSYAQMKAAIAKAEGR
jgi:hypothetical protein